MDYVNSKESHLVLPEMSLVNVGRLTEQGQKVFRSTYLSCTAIRDMSSALEFINVWRHKEIPTQTHPITGLEVRRSPIPVLT